MLTALIRRKLPKVVEAAMKRVSLVLLLIAMGATCASAQQSLADAARQAQADKKAAPAKHVYTNDDIVTPAEAAAEKATRTGAAVSGNAAGKPAADAKTDADKSGDKDNADKKDTKEDAAKVAADFKQKIADQQKAIADMEHEINIMDREHQIKIAEYYADAGTQLRNSAQWFQGEKQFQDDSESKKKALGDAKAKLDELNEQARKAGVPGS
jgi:hypothetical protein